MSDGETDCKNDPAGKFTAAEKYSLCSLGVTKVDAAWKSALDSVDQAGETLEEWMLVMESSVKCLHRKK